MFSDIKESFNKYIYERTVSPLYSTLIVSWVLWNWKAFYFTIFVSEQNVPGKITKLQYVLEHLVNPVEGLIYPLLTSVFMLTVLPFLSIYAFKIDVHFRTKRRNIRNEIEKKQLLTIEESIELHERLIQQDEKFAKVGTEKDKEINRLSLEVANKASSLEQEKQINNNLLLNNQELSSINSNLNKELLSLNNSKLKLEELIKDLKKTNSNFKRSIDDLNELSDFKDSQINLIYQTLASNDQEKIRVLKIEAIGNINKTEFSLLISEYPFLRSTEFLKQFDVKKEFLPSQFSVKELPILLAHGLITRAHNLENYRITEKGIAFYNYSEYENSLPF